MVEGGGCRLRHVKVNVNVGVRVSRGLPSHCCGLQDVDIVHRGLVIAATKDDELSPREGGGVVETDLIRVG